MPWHLPPRVRSRPASLEELQQAWEKSPDQLTHKECWIRILQLHQARLDSGERCISSQQLKDLAAYCLAWPTYPYEKAPELLTDKLREALWAYWPVKELEPVEF
jgi:hypothetical protein